MAPFAFQFPKTTPCCDERSKLGEAESTNPLTGGMRDCHRAGRRDSFFISAARRRGNVSLDSSFHRTSKRTSKPRAKGARLRRRFAAHSSFVRQRNSLADLRSDPLLVAVSSGRNPTTEHGLNPVFA